MLIVLKNTKITSGGENGFCRIYPCIGHLQNTSIEEITY